MQFSFQDFRLVCAFYDLTKFDCKREVNAASRSQILREPISRKSRIVAKAARRR